MKRAILILSLALLGATLAIVPAGGAQDKIDPRLESALAAGDGMISAIVVMADQAELHGTQRADRAQSRLAVLTALRGTARASQTSVLARLGVLKGQGKVAAFESYWIFSGFAVTASADVINELAARPDVARIEPDAEIVMTQSAPAEPNLTAVAAPAMWSSGFTGQGVVVANLDSGVDVNHVDLTSNYRGGGNSWFDPYGEHATPYDAGGHGTGTMAVMVGGSAGGSAIGMAPGAQWIAAKVFNDAGSSSSSAIHSAMQWVLDPDGNPATDDAPDVVNNSWTLSIPGCYTDFQADLQAVRASGIVPVFSAGNAGPGGNSSRSPGNLPEALSVGATDNNGAIAWFSSRGPSACAGDAQFPDLVAPGVAVRTSDLFGLYQVTDGTSFSAPTVAGALALLLSAHPSLTPTHQEAALLESAVDLGNAGPDTTYGWGRLDVAAAHAWLEAGGADPGGTTTTTSTTSSTTSTSTSTTSTSTTSTSTTSTSTTTTSTTTTTVPTDQPPTASFSVSAKRGVYTFRGAGSSDPDGTIVSWVWDFGDGTFGSGETVTNSYGANGTYTVTLTVTDDGGLSDTAVKTVKVGKGGKGGGKRGG